ncbi:MAG: DedA family protein [Deltaproteobacteria bacterium]|nr:DedA family protein [Deltaproteobacteria bacterium]
MLDQLAAWFKDIVETMGYPGLFLLITLESTLVPVPSTLVMPFAGYLAGVGIFSLPAVLIINSTAALLGSGLSYWIGAKGGKPFLVRYGKYFLVRPQDLEKTEQAFAKHGKWVILIGRFIPVVRHIISVPAGIARMPLRPFFLQTFLGSTIWGGFLILLGYYLGENWQTVAAQIKRFDLVIGVSVVLAILVLGIWFVVHRRREQRQNNAD